VLRDPRARKPKPRVECSWKLFRLQYFPGWPNERVAAALGLWSTRIGVRVTFEGRDVRDVPVIFVCFAVP
jgi:hypothetical protein